MKIGLLVGRENTFPQAFIDRVNSKNVRGITAEMMQLGGTTLDDEIAYRLIVDRISHEIPYFRLFLKQAVAQGVIVINNPFWWSADDKYFGCVLAERLGVAVPKTVLLPNLEYDADIIDQSLRNLKEIRWDELVAYTGLPAVLKPAIGGGNKNIHMVDTLDELISAYKTSGSLQMILQEKIEYESYVRCWCLGRKYVFFSRYGHYLPREERYIRDEEPFSENLRERVVGDVLKLCNGLGYDMNTVEMAIRDGIPYAIDFLNPACDMDLHSIREERFEWVVEHMATMCIEYALGEREPASVSWWNAFENLPDRVGAHP